MTDQLQNLQERYPFLTYGTYLSDDYIGIVQNSDNQIITMYMYNLMFDNKLKKLFLELGEEWWWESNRQIPINLFIKKRFDVFKPFLKTFIRKDFKIEFGPIVSLENVMAKRIKRRTIQLVRKL